tara:strand:- start:45 stop:278 length:234 start_codon:yes stop_codon:yes gene_type:complete
MPYGKKDSAMKMKGSWMSKHVQNLFKEMPIDNKASALEMDKGSAAYMKDDKELTVGQKKLDKNGNGKIDGEDFSMMK